MNFGYFWVFWLIFFGYTGIPLPPLADPDKGASVEERPVTNPSIENLCNDDGDGNENGKKAIGLDKQNNNFARASCFFGHFPAIVA